MSCLNKFPQKQSYIHHLIENGYPKQMGVALLWAVACRIIFDDPWLNLKKLTKSAVYEEGVTLKSRREPQNQATDNFS